MIRRFCAFLSILCIFIPCGTLEGDTVFGGETRLSASLLLYDGGSGTVNSIGGYGDFRLFLNAYSDEIDFYFQPRINLDYRSDPAFLVDQLYLEYFPADIITLKAGRFFHLPGVADFFSVINFFHGYDFETLLTGDPAGSIISNDLFQISFYVSSLYARFTIAPFPGQFRLIDEESPWFPSSLIPSTVEIETDETTLLYTLNGIDTVSIFYPNPELRYVSLSGEIGITLSVLDLWAGYYHGIDHDNLFRAHLTFFEYLDNGYYDVTISPVAAVQDSFGLGAVFSIGGFRLWAEGALTLAKTFTTDEISLISRNSIMEETPYLEFNAGAAYTFEQPMLRIAAGYTDGWAFNKQYKHLRMPSASLISVLGSITLFSERLTWSEAFIVEAEKWSFALISSISLILSDTLTVGFVYPFFHGTEDSFFGQYRENYPVSLTLSWKF